MQSGEGEIVQIAESPFKFLIVSDRLRILEDDSLSLSPAGSHYSLNYTAIAGAVNEVLARRTHCQSSYLVPCLFQSIYCLYPEWVTIG
jgi:hypothetical protein